MKKIVLTLAIAISSIASFANDNVTTEALKAFNNEFASASSVEWSESGNLYKASFLFNEQYVTAYYTPQGHLVGVAKNILSLDLPVKLQAKLKNNFADFWITELSEVSNNRGTTYYITLENADVQVKLHSTDNNTWMPVKAIEKNIEE